MVTKKYVQGKSIEEAMEISGMTEIIKVGSNENVLGPSPLAVAAIQRALKDAHLYPDRHEDVLLEKLARQLDTGLKKENFISGNGSCDVLRMMTQTFIKPGHKALISAPTFSMYEILVEMFGGEPVKIPLKEYTANLKAVAEAITDDVSLIFICNPNNPTGTIVTHEQVVEFLDNIPRNVIVIFDEAYMEFAEDPDFPVIQEFIHSGYNVLVTRTFSKLHGLASLRVGYGFGRIDLMNKVKEHKLHFNSGRLAYLGASAALDDEEHINNSIRMVQEGRNHFYNSFGQVGVKYIRTESNFIFLKDLQLDAIQICEEAMSKGVILRPTAPFGLPENIRITIARQMENEKVVEVLKEIFAHHM